MKKILQNISGKFAKKDVSGSLKKKAAVCSAEAAAISIAIHVLIIVFAGSIVAYEYIKRQDAAFEGQNVNRPKLERRQLQMPVKVQNLQKKSRRPKVSSRMTSASKSALALPDMSALGMGLGKDGDAFGAVGAGGDGGTERELSSMGAAGSLGFGVSKVNFFGAKSKGEKIVFIVDTGKAMMEDKKGGYYTYKFVKDRIYQLIGRMKSATLFNVMLYGGKYNPTVTAMFSSTLLPATVENKAALKKWLEPVNSNPKTVGQIENLGNYSPPFEYETEVGSKVQSWLKAAQAAMEQKADNIFILVPGWGRHDRPVDLSLREKWFEEHGWPKERRQRYDDREKERMKKAEALLEKENKARTKKGLPPRIVSSMYSYKNEVKAQLPPSLPAPPQPDIEYFFNEDEIIDHLESVYKFNYIPTKLKKPKIHFVQLIAADADKILTDDVKKLKEVTREFRGDLDYLRGAKTMEDLIKYNDVLDEE